MEEKIYICIANRFEAMLNCIKNGNSEWEEIHKEKIEEIIDNYAPSGSGFDNGTYFDYDNSKKDKLIFATSFHHMNESGYYDGWTDHKIIITPSLVLGFDMRITGKDKRMIKDYIGDMFHNFFHTVIEY